MQAARRNLDVRRHRAVDAVAESFAVRTQIVAAAPAQDALAADLRRRLRLIEFRELCLPVHHAELAHGLAAQRRVLLGFRQRQQPGPIARRHEAPENCALHARISRGAIGVVENLTAVGAAHQADAVNRTELEIRVRAAFRDAR